VAGAKTSLQRLLHQSRVEAGQGTRIIGGQH
jgi:hypothetical protein